MSKPSKNLSDRKKEHIELATKSQMNEWSNDKRFYYEPLFSSHQNTSDLNINFLAKPMRFPLWVSSMTGGTAHARKINENLAAACKEFGLGMGLGSCRILLEDPDKHLGDFSLRHIIGNDQALYANLGIAQLEKISKENAWFKIERMMELLEADGLIIHVNPLQEWLQPEGDRFLLKPLDTIKSVIENIKFPIIVKEVGQGMGPESLKSLMKLPVTIEFGAYGGTNFSELELKRSREERVDVFGDLSYIGHTSNEMIDYVNAIVNSGSDIAVKGVIISGGIRTFLDGFFAVGKIKLPAVYGQASVLLKYAMKSEKKLFHFIENQIAGYNLASNYLTLR